MFTALITAPSPRQSARICRTMEASDRAAADPSQRVFPADIKTGLLFHGFPLFLGYFSLLKNVLPDLFLPGCSLFPHFFVFIHY